MPLVAEMLSGRPSTDVVLAGRHKRIAWPRQVGARRDTRVPGLVGALAVVADCRRLVFRQALETVLAWRPRRNP